MIWSNNLFRMVYQCPPKRHTVFQVFNWCFMIRAEHKAVISPSPDQETLADLGVSSDPGDQQLHQGLKGALKLSRTWRETRHWRDVALSGKPRPMLQPLLMTGCLTGWRQADWCDVWAQGAATVWLLQPSKIWCTLKTSGLSSLSP